MEMLNIRTETRETLISVTAQIQALVTDMGWTEGMLFLHCPHTTAGLTINEDADPSVAMDVVAAMRKLVPHQAGYRHAEGNSDAHIKTSLFGPTLPLIVSDGKIQLGTWQGVYFCEFDGPRNRRLWAQWLGS
jgi:secondary thiamine-phosphate synthase enzyme